MRLDAYIDFQDQSEPKAYLITIRTYGTWLHGDERGSVDRSTFCNYGTAKMPVNPRLLVAERAQLKHPPVKFDRTQRAAVEKAISDVCLHRGNHLLAINARTNHVHCVVSAGGKPELIMNAFKVYATRHLRRSGLIRPDIKPWSRHGSTRWLWTSEEVDRAIDYVLNGQEPWHLTSPPSRSGY